MPTNISVETSFHAGSYDRGTVLDSPDHACCLKITSFRLDPFSEPLHNAALKFLEVFLPPGLHLDFSLSRNLGLSMRDTIATNEPHGGDECLTRTFKNGRDELAQG